MYLNTFKDLFFCIQLELKKTAEKLPANVKYTSPKIQNEVIEVLQSFSNQRLISL